MPDPTQVGKITYKVGDEKYDIDPSEKDAFLVDFPDATELLSFTVDKDTFDIEPSQKDDFLVDFPNAQPTFTSSEKKNPIESSSTDGLQGLQDGQVAPSSEEPKNPLFDLPPLEEILNIDPTKPAPIVDPRKEKSKEEGQLIKQAGLELGKFKDSVFNTSKMKELGEIEMGMYVVDGKPVSSEQLKDLAYNQKWIEDSQKGFHTVEINPTQNPEISQFVDPELEALVIKNLQSGTRSGDKWDNLVAASLSVASGVSGLPYLLNKTAEEITGYPFTITPSGVGGVTPLVSKVLSEDFAKKAEARQEKVMQYRDGFVDSVLKGNYSDAVQQGTNATAGSVPYSVAAGVLTPLAGPAAAFAVLAPIGASSELARMNISEDEKMKGLSDAERLTRAYIVGSAEAGSDIVAGRAITRSFDLSKSVWRGMIKEATEKGGEVAGRKVAEEVSKGILKEYAKNVGLQMGEEYVAEGSSELLTMMTDDLMGISDYSAHEYFKRINESGMLGAFSGGVMTGSLSAPALGIAGTLRVSQDAKKYYDNVLRSKPEALRNKVSEMKDNGSLSEVDEKTISGNIDAREKAVKAVPSDKVSDTETVDLIEEKQKLQEEAKDLDDAFKAPIEKKIAEIDSKLTGKPIEEVKKETTPTVSKTEKVEEKPVVKEVPKADSTVKESLTVETETTTEKARLTKFTSPRDKLYGEITDENGKKRDLTKEEYLALEQQEGLSDVEGKTQTAPPVDKRQKELDDAIAKADAEVAALREADGSVSNENSAAFKEAVKKRGGLQSHGEQNKGTISLKEKAEVGKDRTKFLSEKQAALADKVIQSIIDSGLKDGLSAQEISDQIVARHELKLTEAQAIQKYVAGLVNNTTEQGNSKQSFSAWRQGKMDSDLDVNKKPKQDGLQEDVKSDTKKKSESKPKEEVSKPEAKEEVEVLEPPLDFKQAEDASDVIEGGSKVSIGDTDVILVDKGNNVVELNKIITPDESKRGKGSAKKALAEVTAKADEQGKTIELTVAPENEVVEDSNVDKNPKNYGYHGGTLGGKSDMLTMGYMGEQPFTGYYFYGDRERAEGRGDRSKTDSKEARAVDFSKYNLIKPTTEGYWVLKNGVKRIFDNILKERSFDSEIDRIEGFIPEVGKKLRENKDKIDGWFDEWQEIKDANFAPRDYEKSKTERFETFLLKKLGYEGVDVRGLKERSGDGSPDKGAEGSVIFDLKPETVVDITPKEQVTKEGLVKMYKEAGFVSDGKGDLMRREAKKTESKTETKKEPVKEPVVVTEKVKPIKEERGSASARKKDLETRIAEPIQVPNNSTMVQFDSDGNVVAVGYVENGKVIDQRDIIPKESSDIHIRKAKEVFDSYKKELDIYGSKSFSDLNELVNKEGESAVDDWIRGFSYEEIGASPNSLSNEAAIGHFLNTRSENQARNLEKILSDKISQSNKETPATATKEVKPEKVSESETNKEPEKATEAEIRTQIKALLAESDAKGENFEDTTEIDAEIEKLAKSLPQEESKKEFTEEEITKAEDEKLSEQKKSVEGEMTPQDWIRENITLSKKDVQDHADLKAWEESKGLYKNIVDWTNDKESLAFQLKDLSEKAGYEITIEEVIEWANSVAAERNTTGTTEKKIPAMKARKKPTVKTKRSVTADSLREMAQAIKDKNSPLLTPEGNPIQENNVFGTVTQKALESLADVMDGGAKLLESEKVDYLVNFIRNHPLFKALPKIQRKALRVREYVRDNIVKITEDQYIDSKVKSLNKKSEADKKEAVKETKKEASGKLKEEKKNLRQSLKANFSERLKELKAKEKSNREIIRQAKKEALKSIREADTGFSKLQTAKIARIVGEMTVSNFEKKTDEIEAYIDSVEAKKKEGERKSLVSDIRKRMNPRNYTRKSQTSGKRKKIGLTSEATKQLRALNDSFGEELDLMDANSLRLLSELVNSIVETGKANRKQIEAFRKSRTDENNRITTEMVHRKAGNTSKLEGGKDAAIKELSAPKGTERGGNAIVIGDIIIPPTKEGRRLAESMEESDFDGAVVVKYTSAAATAFDKMNAPVLEKLKGNARRFAGFVYSDTDMNTIIHAIASTREDLDFLQDRVMTQAVRVNERIFSDRKKLVQKMDQLKSSILGGKIKGRIFLEKKSGIEIKDTDGGNIVRNMTNDEVVYLYNQLKNSDSIAKALNSKMTKESLLEVIDYVNKTPKLKKYADSLTEMFDSYLGDVNASLDAHGYLTIEPETNISLKENLEKNTGKEGEENIKRLESEIKDLKDEVKNTSDADERKKAEKELAKKEKQLKSAELAYESGSLQRELMEAIYGDIENIPEQIPYSPRSVEGTDPSVSTPDELWGQSDTGNAVNVLSNNTIERTKGGSLKLQSAETMAARYIDSMTNTVHKISMYEDFHAMFSDGSQVMMTLKKKYGSQFTNAIRSSTTNMITGKNGEMQSSGTGMKDVTKMGAYAWVARASADVMNFNLRSAVFQGISVTNFVHDAFTKQGLGVEYIKAIANQKQLKIDVKEIMESGHFWDRINNSMDPVMKDLTEIRDKSRVMEAVDKIYEYGYTPTKYMDMATVVIGGTPLYSALKKKYFEEFSKTMPDNEAKAKAKEKAMTDFWYNANETQQSSLQAFRSWSQNNPIARTFVAFGSVSALYTRATIRAVSDVKNKRISLSEGAMRVLYYGVIQNLMFLPLQQGILFASSGLMAMAGGSDDEKDKKEAQTQSGKIFNGILNSTLRGLGAYGALLAMAKDIGIDVLMMQASKSEKESVKKAYDNLKHMSKTYRRSKDMLIQEVFKSNPPLAIKFNEFVTVSDDSRDPERSEAEKKWNGVDRIMKGAQFAGVPTRRWSKLGDAIADVNYEHLTKMEDVARLTEMMSRYQMEQNIKAEAPPTATGALKTESKEQTEEVEAAKQLGLDAIVAKQKTPTYIRASTYGEAKEYRKAVNKGRESEMITETAQRDIAESHNIEVFKATTKDKTLVSAFITSDGEGKTVRTEEDIAAEYIDNVINARGSKIKDISKLTPAHETALKNMLKHLPLDGENTRYSFAREVNKEIARQKKVLEESKKENK